MENGDRLSSYRSRDDDVTNCSIPQGPPWSWSLSITNFGKDDALVQIDTIEGNVTESRSAVSWRTGKN